MRKDPSSSQYTQRRRYRCSPFWFNCSGRTFGNAYNRRTVSTPGIDSSETSARFFLKVEGESMNRTLPNESYALIDPTLKEIHEGKVYAVSVDNSAATIKGFMYAMMA